MKKLFSLFIAIIISTSFISAQNNDTDFEALKKQIVKSDADIQNPKKNIKSATWVKRANIFIKAYTINFKYLAVGIEAYQIPLLSGADGLPYYGAPLKDAYAEDNFTVYEYKRIKIYVDNSTNRIDHWVETEVIDTLALDKAYDAYIKAIELDDKGTLASKKSTLEDLAFIREYLVNRAVDKYYAGQHEKAMDGLEKAIDLLKYKDPADTNKYAGSYYYYAGIFSYNAKQLETSLDYFKKSIENEYEIGTSYQYASQIYYELNDSTAAVKFLESGANKFPEETKIIYSLIDYYNPRGEFSSVFKYINKAIDMTKDNPNPVLYIVKGNAYERIFKTFEDKYFNLLFKADSLSKAAFRARTNPTEQKRINDEKDDILNNSVPQAKKEMLGYADSCIAAYNEAIAVEKEDLKKADYEYSIALFYYNYGKDLKTNSSRISNNLSSVIAELDKESSEYLEKAKEHGEEAYNLNSKDRYTLSLMQRIYYNLGMTDKSDQMKKELNEL